MFATPTAPDGLDGIVTCSEFGKAEDNGLVLLTTLIWAPFTADQAFKADDVPFITWISSTIGYSKLADLPGVTC